MDQAPDQVAVQVAEERAPDLASGPVQDWAWGQVPDSVSVQESASVWDEAKDWAVDSVSSRTW